MPHRRLKSVVELRTGGTAGIGLERLAVLSGSRALLSGRCCAVKGNDRGGLRTPTSI
jgi:hypothetical protein